MPTKKKTSKKKASKKTADRRAEDRRTANIQVMKSRGAYRRKGGGVSKKKPPRKKPSTANARVMKKRGAHPFEDKTGAPRSTPLKDTDLSSFWSMNGALKWIGEKLLSGEILPATASELRLILSTAAENQKKRLQSHGKWIEKTERKDELVVISAELGECLERVQGSSPADLQKIQGQVKEIMGGLRG